MLRCISIEVRSGELLGCIWNARSEAPWRPTPKGDKQEMSLHFAREVHMGKFWRKVWSNDEGQDIAEYAVMLAVILVIVVGTIRLIGANANNVFSSVASSISQ